MCLSLYLMSPKPKRFSAFLSQFMVRMILLFGIGLAMVSVLSSRRTEWLLISWEQICAMEPPCHFPWVLGSGSVFRM